MLYFILATILVLIIVGCLGGSFLAVDPEAKTGSRVAAGVFGLIFVILTAAFSATTVGARSVGVVTSFGKYQSTLDNGFHWTAPWAGVEQFSTQVQYLDLDGQGDSVPVTFNGGGGGAVNATVRWRIDAAGAEALWKKYRTFDNVRDQLVNSAAKDSFRVVVAKYTPNEARSGENLRPIATATQVDLAKTLLDDGVTIDSVSIKGISLDKASQESLDKIVIANNNVERANAEQLRAKIDAKTAEIRKAGGSLTGAALIRYCLEVTNGWDQARNGPLPAGWNCFSPSTLVSAGK